MTEFRRICYLVVRVVLAAALLAAAPPARSAEDKAVPASAGATVLSNDSYLRSYLVFRTPVCIARDGKLSVPLEPVGKDPKPLETYQSPPPPDGWMKPEFDDSCWERQNPPVELAPGSATGHSQAARYTAAPNSIICLRWKFMAEDPEKAGDLKLSLEYVGGAAVYVNGQELTRGHLPAGELKVDTLAEKYPDDLHCEADGTYLQDPARNPAGFERRYRRLTDVTVPARLLVKGGNVLAVRIHRAAINEPAIAARRAARAGSGMGTVPGMWAYAGLKSISLTAPGGGATPNIGRPGGIQVWNVAAYETVTAFDYGDPGRPLPIEVAAARNGVFSGRLVVSSDRAIRGLKVQVSELVRVPSTGSGPGGGGASIPAAAVRVRYAAPAETGKSWAPPHRFDGLLDAVPAEIAVVNAPVPRERRGAGFRGTCGALAPLWFSVRVPKDAQPGRYEGSVTVSAQGLAPTTVPLRVEVSAWCLPDPRDFRTHNFALLSEDAIAKHYGAELWSDRHLALMAKSLELMAEINSRQVAVNLAVNFYSENRADCSNEQSLVRWVRQPDGSFRYDFGAFDKYMDLVTKTIGKPTLLRVNCWPGIKMKNGQMVCNDRMPVTVLDPASGKLESLEQPMPGTDESLKFWKPVLDEVRKRIEARGWWDVTAVGHNSYATRRTRGSWMSAGRSGLTRSGATPRTMGPWGCASSRRRRTSPCRCARRTPSGLPARWLPGGTGRCSSRARASAATPSATASTTTRS